MSRVRIFVALLALAFAAAWPQLTLGEWRGTEARRVQIASEMAAGGSALVPTLFGEPTLAKPPLYYWVLVTTMRVAGNAPWLLRLPSVLAFVVLALVVHRVLRQAHGEAAAWIGAIGVIASPMVMQDGPVAEIDPFFAAMTACSIVLLARGVAWRETLSLLGGGLCGGLAFLAKGPPFFLFLAGALLVWGRRRRLRGILWFLVPLALPPALWMLALRHAGTGLEDLATVASEESWQRLFQYEWRHVLDTPVYFGRAILALLPLGLWTWHRSSARSAPGDSGSDDADLLVRITGAAAIGAILGLALFPGRPMRYLLPAAPLYVCSVAPAVARYAVGGTVTALQHTALRALGVAAGIGLLLLGTPFGPAPVWSRTIVLLLAAGVAARLVTRPVHVVACALALPLLAGPTLLTDVAEYQAALRAGAPVGAILRRELQSRGAHEVGTLGHVPAALLRMLDVPVAGDEFARRPPRHDWLLVEDPDRTVQLAVSIVPGYHERLRVRMLARSIVLLERDRG